MCKFFSLVSDGTGKIYYLNAEQREATKGKYESPDSHTYIADYYGFKGSKEDKLNKYEYNPLTKVLTADQINTTDDRISVGQKCKRLNFKTIVPQLIIHPIFNPVKSKRCKKVVESDLDLLARWASVWGSVWGSVRDSVGDSVRASVWAYASSLFDIQYKHDFSPLITLWNKGLVPSFDGKVWRLHGYKGKILWEGNVAVLTKEEVWTY